MANKNYIFDRFASNLAKVCPQIGKRYACPLTLKLFEEKDIHHLSIEHCIPNGLGPERFVLTDIRANNASGSDIDANLHRMVGYLEFIRDGVGSIPIRMQLGDVEVGAEFTRDTSSQETKNDFRIDAVRSNPKAVQQAQKDAENGNFPTESRLRFHPHYSFVDRRAKIGLLKAAYLMLFRQLGYSLILHPAFDIFRRQIADPSDKLLPIDKIVVAVLESLPQPVFWVQKPECLFAYGYDFQLRKGKNAQSTGFRVFLPCSPYSVEKWREIQPGEHRYGFVNSNFDYINNPRKWIETISD